jgi:hypothetical protein
MWLGRKGRDLATDSDRGSPPDGNAPSVLPNGIELSRLASPRILPNAGPDTGLARSAPASC